MQPAADPKALAIFIIAYVALQIGLGIFISRFIKTEEDYFLAGQSMPLLPVGLSIFATWFGAETIMGSAGAIASEGLAGARAEPIGYALCLVAMAFVISGVFRARGYVNLADFFAKRFDHDSELATALITILVSTIWAAAQLLAISALLETALGVPEQFTLIVAVGAVVAYTSFSGIVGDIWTDMIHNAVLTFGLIFLLFALVGHMGGLHAMLATIEPRQLEFVHPGESWLSRVDNWAIPVLGSLVTQEVIARFLTTKSPKDARNATLMAGGLYSIMGFVPLLIALGGVHAFKLPANVDDFLPAIASAILPSWAYILFAGALLSAVMSVTNANVLSVSSMVSISVLRRFHAHASERTKLRTARLSTIGAGLAAYVIASSGQTIYQLIALTSVWGQAGILVAVLFGLWSGYGGARAAMWSILACLATNVWTLTIGPVLAVMHSGAGFTVAVQKLLAGEAPTIEGYFLLSILVSVLAYFAGAETEMREAPTPASAP